MSRLHAAFAGLRSRGEKALGLFLTSGFPEREATLPLLRSLDEGGADFIELGMPFSDPLAEGLPIQRASERALRNGITMEETLATAAAFRARSDTPLLLMGYTNPLFRFGIAAFCHRAAEAGVDGLILPDLPPEERGLVAQAAAEGGLDLVHLIAPNTPDTRIEAIDRLSTGFVYAVSITGLTGSGLGVHDAVEAYLRRARRLVVRNPLVVGFGIRSGEDAARLTRHTDGFIVGSALIECVEQLWDRPELSNEQRLAAVRRFARELKQARPLPTDAR